MAGNALCVRQAKSLVQWVEIWRLYRAAFPLSERKPLAVIRAMQKRGRTDVWHFSRGGRFAGFAATINSEKKILLDYLAVPKKLRGAGVGAEILESLKTLYAGRGIFVEIESTRPGVSDREGKMRRKRFYEKAGFADLQVRAEVFGVEMELLGLNCSLDFEEYHAFYRDQYNPWAADHVRAAEP